MIIHSLEAQFCSFPPMQRKTHMCAEHQFEAFYSTTAILQTHFKGLCDISVLLVLSYKQIWSAFLELNLKQISTLLLSQVHYEFKIPYFLTYNIPIFPQNQPSQN